LPPIDGASRHIQPMGCTFGLGYGMTEATAVIRRADVVDGREVAPHKRVRAVEVIDEIPKLPSGKILRRLLADGAPG
jgi:hypothetical protein